MSGHLRAVPDPEDDSANADGWPVPVHAVPTQTATALPPAAPPAAPPAVEDEGEEQFPGEPGGLEDAGDVEHQADEDGCDDEGERPTGRHGFTLPDLSPYYDVRPLAELGPLAVEITRQGAPPLLRFLGRFLRNLVRMITWYARGTGVLLALGAAWLSGNIGKRGTVGARLAGAGFALYAAVKLSMEYAAAPLVILVLVLVVVVIAARGDIKPPEKKAPEKKDGKGKSTAKTKATGKATDKAAAESEDESPAEVEEEAPAAKPRPGLLSRLAPRRKTPAESPDEDPTQSPAETCASPSPEVGEETDAEAYEAPVEDPLTTLIRAEIGGENGVHLKHLRPAMRKALPGLSQATDEHLRTVLVAAGWDPSKKFRARGAAGLTGVHRSQLPPLPSPGGAPGPSPAPLSAPLHPLPPADSSPPSGALRPGGERSGEWTAEDLARGWRWVPDPNGRPTAWQIQHYEGR